MKNIQNEIPRWFSVIIPTLNEEENIERLVRSIQRQDYRPIETIVVDGGSQDNTLEILKTLKKEEDPQFKIRILTEEDSGNPPCPGNARNFGLDKSSGEYILFLNGDAVLIEENFLTVLSRELRNHLMIWHKYKILVDNWLEYNTSLNESSSQCLAPAFRREVFENVKFDPSLGAGEDYDFLHRLRKQGILSDEIKVVDAWIGLHDVHTLRAYLIQKFWHGRTFWLYFKKHPSVIKSVLMQSGPIALLFLALTMWGLQYFFASSLMLLTWFIGVLYLFINSPYHGADRLIFILLMCSLGSLVRVIGLLRGLYEYMIGTLTPGRKPYWKAA